MFSIADLGSKKPVSYSDGLENYPPLIRAIKRNRMFSLTSLLPKTTNVDERDQDSDTPLMHAVHEGHVDMVKCLIKAGANFNLCNDWGFTPLIIAARQGRTAVVPLLLATNEAIDRCDQQGMSALMSAARRGHFEIVRMLLVANANVLLEDFKNETAYAKAIFRGHAGVVKLLATTVLVNKRDELDNTPLMLAAKTGNREIIKALVEAKADLNSQNEEGMSALMIAAEYGREEVVNYLLLAGANATLKDKSFATAFNWAERSTEIFLGHFLSLSYLSFAYTVISFNKPLLLYRHLLNQDFRDPQIFNILCILLRYVAALKNCYSLAKFQEVFPLDFFIKAQDYKERLCGLEYQEYAKNWVIVRDAISLEFWRGLESVKKQDGQKVIEIIMGYDAPLQHGNIGFFSSATLKKNKEGKFSIISPAADNLETVNPPLFLPKLTKP